MTEQQIREIVREIVREEMKTFSPDNLKDMVSEMVAQELLAREDFSNISLTEYLILLSIQKCTILFYPIKILMPYLLNLLFYTNYL